MSTVRRIHSSGGQQRCGCPVSTEAYALLAALGSANTHLVTASPTAGATLFNALFTGAVSGRRRALISTIAPWTWRVARSAAATSGASGAAALNPTLPPCADSVRYSRSDQLERNW